VGKKNKAETFENAEAEGNKQGERGKKDALKRESNPSCQGIEKKGDTPPSIPQSTPSKSEKEGGEKAY